MKSSIRFTHRGARPVNRNPNLWFLQEKDPFTLSKLGKFTSSLSYMLCISTSEHGRKRSKLFKNEKKVLFSSCVQEGHKRLANKNEEKVCWSAIGSDS